MHDIDRTQQEVFDEADALELNGFEFTDTETDAYALESPFTEEQEIDLASELLTLSSDQELDQFFGKLVRRVGGLVRKVARSPVTRALGGALRGVAKKALPTLGGALGTAIGGPAGAALGRAAGGVVGGLLEYDGIGGEQEFEIARRIIRTAGQAAHRVINAPPGDPWAIVRSAVSGAVRTHLPALLQRHFGQSGEMGPSGVAPVGMRANAGRWVRRGRSIIVIGA